MKRVEVRAQVLYDAEVPYEKVALASFNRKLDELYQSYTSIHDRWDKVGWQHQKSTPGVVAAAAASAGGGDTGVAVSSEEHLPISADMYLKEVSEVYAPGLIDKVSQIAQFQREVFEVYQMLVKEVARLGKKLEGCRGDAEREYGERLQKEFSDAQKKCRTFIEIWCEYITALPGLVPGFVVSQEGTYEQQLASRFFWYLRYGSRDVWTDNTITQRDQSFDESEKLKRRVLALNTDLWRLHINLNNCYSDVADLAREIPPYIDELGSAASRRGI